MLTLFRQVARTVWDMEGRITEVYSRPGDGESQRQHINNAILTVGIEGELTWLDAKCLAVVKDFVITSPNVDYIPWFNLGRCRVQPRADGRFGLADYTLTPQRFSEKFPHSALITEPPARQTSRQAAFWLTPSEKKDFEPLHGTAFLNLGHLRQGFVDRVEPFFKELAQEVANWEKNHERDWELSAILTNTTQALGRLKYAAYTFRDLVNDFAYFSHNMLDLNARIAFVTKYNFRSHVQVGDAGPGNVARWAIGAWTAEPVHVQWLLRAGIPVWYVRTKEQFVASMSSRLRPNVQKVTEMQAPPGWVCVDAPKDHLDRDVATPIIYEGASNDTLHAFSRRPLFLGKSTIAKLADLPAKAPDVDGVYDEYTIRDVTGPPTTYSVPGDTHNSAVHRQLTAAKAAHENQSVTRWRSEVPTERSPSPPASSSWGIPSTSSHTSPSVADGLSVFDDDAASEPAASSSHGDAMDEEDRPLRRKRKSTAQRKAAKRAREADPSEFFLHVGLECAPLTWYFRPPAQTCAAGQVGGSRERYHPSGGPDMGGGVEDG